MQKLYAVYSSNVEASQSFPITLNTAADPEQWADVYVILLPEPLLKGDFVEVEATAEFTNNSSVIAGIVWTLALVSGEPTPAASIPPGASILLSPPVGEDVDPNYVHHLPVTPQGFTKIVNDNFVSNASMRLRAAAQSTAAQAGMVIEVMQGYGQMWAKVFR